LADFFEQRFSVDEVRRYKPAEETYRFVKHQLRLSARDCCMIACHTWDTLGALAAGWDAALVLRSGNAPLTVGPQPHIVGKDLSIVAESLLARQFHTIRGLLLAKLSFAVATEKPRRVAWAWRCLIHLKAVSAGILGL
jgi:beta-phosphoglucomutase-like phosphatase (HAD superfamily)